MTSLTMLAATHDRIAEPDLADVTGGLLPLIALAAGFSFGFGSALLYRLATDDL